MLKNIENFIGCESDYKSADIALFGAPFDSTTSYRPGARFAMKAMRAESYGLETYSPYQDADMSEIKVFDAGNLELPAGDTENSLEAIEKICAEIASDGKIPVMVGGEHLVTLGAVRALKKRYGELYVIHFDAHTDLRDEYMGVKLSHACVIRRIFETVGEGVIFQFGIRSGEKSEFIFGEKHTNLVKYGFDGLCKTVERLKGKNVYFTLDLDVLDPSVLPGTGTPEAGGVSFAELLDAVIEVGGLNLVGADITELAPALDASGCSTAVACKILRELLLTFKK
ncbi:MAG: agmatinase [Clostridiales bacterium]|jgi:agmatinase|nr:agmatinase [Clostridiales bacterium]